MGNILFTVARCSACGRRHERLEFKALTYPVHDDAGEAWTHWAVCPFTGEMIFIRAEARRLADPEQDMVC